MWPLLKAGGGTGTERDVAVVANMSARVGSIGDNRLGGWHSYRASKAALNQCKFYGLEFWVRKNCLQWGVFESSFKHNSHKQNILLKFMSCKLL